MTLDSHRIIGFPGMGMGGFPGQGMGGFPRMDIPVIYNFDF
ncbi:hypothetical protein [Bacillus cereus]|nr:hypothetical protein [Bacillus cereus]